MEIQSIRNMVMDTDRVWGVKNAANIKNLANNSENNECFICTVECGFHDYKKNNKIRYPFVKTVTNCQHCKVVHMAMNVKKRITLENLYFYCHLLTGKGGKVQIRMRVDLLLGSVIITVL